MCGGGAADGHFLPCDSRRWQSGIPDLPGQRRDRAWEKDPMKPTEEQDHCPQLEGTVVSGELEGIGGN